MNVTLIVASANDTVIQYVRDFAKGLGCAVESGQGEVRIELADSDTGDVLVQVLDFVGLTAIKAGVDLQEPLCRLMYRRGASAQAQVTLGLRCVELTLDQ